MRGNARRALFSSLGKRLCLSGFCHIEAGAFSCFFILSRKSGEKIDKYTWR